MDPVSFPKGFLLSSTPVQSSQDSGYFGSDHRRYKSNVNVFNSCSPVKESSSRNVSEISPFHHKHCGISPQLKFKTGIYIDSSKNESLPHLEINESSELRFTSFDFSFQRELCKTCPSITKAGENLDIHNSSSIHSTGFYSSLSEDRDIKYNLFEYESSDLLSTNNSECLKNFSESSIPSKYTKLASKQTKIDFIHELKMRNCLSIISHLLTYLSAKELCIASCVSKEWNKVVLNDYDANLRKANFIEERVQFLNGPSKENRLGMKNGPAKEHKKAFSDLTNFNVLTHLQPVNSKVTITRFESFIKEAKSGQKLQKCPKCGYASKYLDGNNCECTHCSYRFCCNCLGPLLKSHTCFKQEIPNIIVGSKRSKKNLRRLK